MVFLLQFYIKSVSERTLEFQRNNTSVVIKVLNAQ